MKIKEVIIYTNPFCMPCIWVKNWLDSKKINYAEKVIVDNEENFNELKTLNSEGTPTIRVSYEDGTEEIIIGYLVDKLEKVFHIK
ncbi:glutaredoxin family protein [Bacillus cereus]|uniref:glutaredoxin family protein n=1 Tax=Bacillus cereus TaxID=1396 RepID=UPI000BED666E|nr:glutaredoxin family protein [Bacillus cereus]PDY77415.1 hypothetical protein CON06_26850 [Bacillus cereus]PFA13191.1 hypothetical protein CN382_13985 [Bacillus cereus]PFM33691.1 hypothetical protein COJ43_25435 [Bacillus cereus]